MTRNETVKRLTIPRFIRRWKWTFAYLMLTAAVAFSIYSVQDLANRFDQDARERSSDIRSSQLEACLRTNRLRVQLVQEIPSLSATGELEAVRCADKYPTLRK